MGEYPCPASSPQRCLEKRFLKGAVVVLVEGHVDGGFKKELEASHRKTLFQVAGLSQVRRGLRSSAVKNGIQQSEFRWRMPTVRAARVLLRSPTRPRRPERGPGARRVARDHLLGRASRRPFTWRRQVEASESHPHPTPGAG